MKEKQYTTGLRKLVAIMFTDIAGYTALMGKDEQLALQILHKNRKIHQPLIKKFRGKWLKEMGDGVLASFDSASDAVRCACAIQKAAKSAELPLRIGIHQGEVVLKEDDVIGDGVNVASRLEASGEVGVVHISEAVYYDIANKRGIHTEYVDEKSFKNVERPVRVYKVECDDEFLQDITTEYATLPRNNFKRVLLYILAAISLIIIALLILKFLPVFQQDKMEKSIAVIPFRNDSEEEGTEYFANGVMESIINHLSAISDFDKVPGRTSVEQFREGKENITRIGEILGVNYIVEGSVQKYGDQIRVVVQLLHTEMDDHIWSNTYQYEYKEQFKIMAEIAEDVARNLKTNIAPEELEIIEKVPTNNLTAYDFYLRGREEYMRWMQAYPQSLNDPALLDRSKRLYEQALEYDSTYAKAYAGLGLVYWNRSGMYRIYFRQDALDSMLIFAEKALFYDDKLADAYYVRSYYYGIDMGDNDQALKDLNKALNLDPNHSWAYQSRGIIQIKRGYYLEAIQDFHKGISVDYSFYRSVIMGNLIMAYQICGFFDEAKHYAMEVSKLSGRTTLYPGFIVNNAILQEDFETAIEIVEKDYLANQGNAYKLLTLLILKIQNGNNEEAQDYANQLLEITENWKRVPNRAEWIGYVLWQHGKKEEARVYFEKVIEQAQRNIELKLTNENQLHAIANPGHFTLAEIYALTGETENAYRHLEKFVSQRSFPYGAVSTIKNDPFFNDMREEERFQKIVAEITAKYQREHNRVKAWLEETSRTQGES